MSKGFDPKYAPARFGNKKRRIRLAETKKKKKKRRKKAAPWISQRPT
jgi:hypothetical protein